MRCPFPSVFGSEKLIFLSSNAAPALKITYKRPRAASPPPLLLPSDDESDLPDPSLLSPPPSPTLTAASDSDEDAEFEEVLPLGANGQPLASAVEAQERKKKEKKEKKDRREKEKEGRRKERERRRRERRKIEERNAYKAEWLPGLPPKHSWKQTPVRYSLLSPFFRSFELESQSYLAFSSSPTGLSSIRRAASHPPSHLANPASPVLPRPRASLDPARAPERLAARRRLPAQPYPPHRCPLLLQRTPRRRSSRRRRRSRSANEGARAGSGGCGRL